MSFGLSLTKIQKSFWLIINQDMILNSFPNNKYHPNKDNVSLIKAISKEHETIPTEQSNRTKVATMSTEQDAYMDPSPITDDEFQTLHHVILIPDNT